LAVGGVDKLARGLIRNGKIFRLKDERNAQMVAPARQFHQPVLCRCGARAPTGKPPDTAKTLANDTGR
jgi:hypothetical protein